LGFVIYFNEILMISIKPFTFTIINFTDLSEYISDLLVELIDPISMSLMSMLMMRI
jgi:hypothetical protein